jgi:hypothetical protein
MSSQSPIQIQKTEIPAPYGARADISGQDREDLDLLIRGFQVSRMLRLVADLGIPDDIEPADAVPVARLAAAHAIETGCLIRVLRALASFRVFVVTEDGTVSHTARSLLLRKDTPNSMYDSARFWTGPGSWKAWGMLDEAMTGGNPYEAAWGMSRFAYLRQHPDEARAFDAMMASFPDDRHAAISTAYDFSGATCIADLGGGNGAALRHILARFPAAKGLLVDRPDVVSNLSSDELLDGRIRVQAGDFFEGAPRGADIYMLVRVLHDWSDEDCVRILRGCRAAMDSSATLLLGEEILEPDPQRGRPSAYLIDIQMMTMFGHARARTEKEFAGLLGSAGLQLSRIVPTASSVSIVEARPRTAP